MACQAVLAALIRINEIIIFWTMKLEHALGLTSCALLPMAFYLHISIFMASCGEVLVFDGGSMRP